MKILLLAGTSQARVLGQELTQLGHEVISSLSGATRAPSPPAGRTRHGGFGGDAGFEAWLGREQPDLVLDATHPFAEQITKRSEAICRRKGVAYVLLNRPEWPVDAALNQFEIKTAQDARGHIPSDARVFLATGRQTLAGFENLSDCTLFCRQIDPPDAPFPFPNGEYVIGRPPFSVADEVALFKRLTIDVLVVKNAGGAASASKLDAAAELGIKTLVISRPPVPVCPSVETVADALTWVAAHAHH